ncbi:unnamed protein product [Toxocara canis]|uniref:Adaptin_N domain-containing protein n=1 Tax=Toxocara canis TaxID=6265 RepID=A0A183U9S3_TOXCA|nr:unnamed protein product [Toxocara canis]
MLEDVETIAKHMGNIQRKSACRAMAVFADERYNLVASGDKTLIAALFSSNINPCLRLSAAKKLDKVTFAYYLLAQ